MGDLQDRLERARNGSFEHEVVADDPTIVQVTNNDSGRIHSVVVDHGYCSCEDATYRDVVDKHVLYLIENADPEIADELRDHLGDELAEIEREISDLGDEIESLQAEKSELEADANEIVGLIDSMASGQTTDESDGTDSDSPLGRFVNSVTKH